MAGSHDYYWAPKEGTDVADIRALVPYAVERVPGADPAEVRRALQAAVRRFLSDTGVWVREIPCAGEDNVVKVSVGGSARVTAILKIVRDSDGVAVYSAVEPVVSRSSKPYDTPDGRFALALPTDGGETYTATATLTTAFGSDWCPEWVLSRWGEVIAGRAAHDLLVKANPAMTVYYADYQDAVREVIGRRAMSGSFAGSGQSSGFSPSLERF